MKRIIRDYTKFESLNLFSALQPAPGAGSLYDPKRRESFLAQIDAGLERALNSESTLHGLRVQALFEHMVPSFRSVKLMKQEDAGECYGDDVALPDYMVVTANDERLLIEVKNHYGSDATRPFRLRSDDLRKLRTYATLVGTPLRIAVYWARWNAWTLNDPGRFNENGRFVELEFPIAMKENSMIDLGDYMIATRYPLAVRMIADASKPRRVDADGRVAFTIGEVEILCDGRVIRDKAAHDLAFRFTLFGDWDYDGPRAEFEEERDLLAVVHSFEPRQKTPNQGFEMIGSLSSMFSKRYNMLTLREDGSVGSLKRFDDPSRLGPVIPDDYSSEDLPLWRFRLGPNLG